MWFLRKTHNVNLTMKHQANSKWRIKKIGQYSSKNGKIKGNGKTTTKKVFPEESKLKRCNQMEWVIPGWTLGQKMYTNGFQKCMQNALYV